MRIKMDLTHQELETRKFIGKKIRRRRKQLKLTQSKVAEKIGVTFQQVQKYEKGTNGLSDYMIRRLRIVFKIHKSKILFLMNKYNRRIK